MSRITPGRLVLRAALAVALTTVVARPAFAEYSPQCAVAVTGTYHLLIKLPSKELRDAMLVLEEEDGCVVGTLIVEGERAVRLSDISIIDGMLTASVATTSGRAEFSATLTGKTSRGALVVRSTTRPPRAP